MIHTDLRPLGIGEILDRAVHLFVRHFAVLVFILALVALPVAICQYIAQPQATAFVEELQRVLALPAGHAQDSAAALTHLLEKNRIGPVGFALVIVSTILGALSSTACIIAVGQSYAGKLPSVRQVYAEAVRRWLAQLVALGAFLALGFAGLLGLFVIVFLIALATRSLAAVSMPLATIAAIPIGVGAILGLIAVAALGYFTAQMSSISIALEEPNPVRGILDGVRRTLSPPVFWRSLLVAMIVLVVSAVGEVLLLTVAAGVSAVTHLSFLYPVLAVVGGVVLNGLVLTFIVIYATDIRVRREGYDLALAAREPAL